MTYQELKEAITRKKFFIVEEFNNGFLHEIGYKTKQNGNVIHWFCIYSDQFVMFSHSYSMNTGKTYKSIKHGLNISYQLTK